jgi:hypothetical protein
MRDNVRAIVRVAAETLALDGPVYEFGSYQVEDQIGLADLRSCFPNRKYIGCDMRPGPGVDRVEDLGELTLPDGVASTIVCVETLEHVFEVRRAADEMMRVLAPGGVMIVTTPFDFRLHDYPSDYWRLTPSCMARLFAPLDGLVVGWQGLENDPHTVFAIGCKAPLPDYFASGVTRFTGSFQAWLTDQAAQVPMSRVLKRWTIGLLRSKGERRRELAEFDAGYSIRLPAQGDWRTAVGFEMPAKQEQPRRSIPR